jgi:hypothetical protein
MSTELKSIQGRHEKTELAKQGGYETVYSQAAMSLTRFAGGPEIGPMLQITLPQNGDDYFSHIQLNRDQVQDLVNELRNHFDIE